PTTTEAPSPASSRPTTIAGLPGNATAVATRTIGLMAGADSRKANAAAGVTPLDTGRAGRGRGGHREHRAPGQQPREQTGRHEGGDRRTYGDPQYQERYGLHRD